jgi:hypothetical protein
MADPNLVKAVKGNSINGVTKLLNGRGINVNQANDKGRTALWLASHEQQIRIMEKLLDAGADVNKADNVGKTPLFVASEQGHQGAVKMLLDAGADVNKADKNGKTPLSVASIEPIKELIISKMLNIPFNQVGININIIISGSQTVDDLKLILCMTGQENIANKITETNINGARKQAKTLHIKYLENLKAKAKAEGEARRKAKENAELEEARQRANTLRRKDEEEKAIRVSQVARNFKTVLQTKVAERKEANTKAAANKAAANKAAANKEAANKAAANKAAANKAAAEKAEKNKEATNKAVANKAIFAEKIKKIKSGNFNLLTNDIFTSLSDSELKGILQTLSLNGKTDEHKEMMKKLLKKWIESGKNLNSAEISKKSNFIKSLNADINKITNNYALRQKFIGTESKISERTFGWNDPNTIKKALLSQNGRQKIIKSYDLRIPPNSPIPEIVSALHGSKQPKFVNTVKLNSLKKEYQRLIDAYSDNTSSKNYKNLISAIASIPNSSNPVQAQATATGTGNGNGKRNPVNANANAKVKEIVNKMSKEKIAELLRGNVKIGLVLKSNGNPYKLVNYTKLNNAIRKFKANGKPQPLNNNAIITNAANGTWSLVEVSKNLIKQ